jgi:DNA-directed RNA polymerase specialized sigma24 family protein
MYALAYTLLRDRNEARDCVQDVYAELWENRDTMETSNALLPRVLNMVRNNCRDRLCAGGEHVCDSNTTDAPIVIVNVDGYYDHLLQQLDRSMQENFMRNEHRDIWCVATTAEEAIDLVFTTPLIDESVRRFAKT